MIPSDAFRDQPVLVGQLVRLEPLTDKVMSDYVSAPLSHAKAIATIRDHLIRGPGRLARSARQLVLHLPVDWPWEQP